MNDQTKIDAEAQAKAAAEAQAQAEFDAKAKADAEAIATAEAKAKDVAEAEVKGDAARKAVANIAADALKADIAEAKANAQDKAAPKAKKPRKGSEAAPLDAGRLRELIAVVEAGNVPTQRGNLIHRLEVEENADFDDEDGAFTLTLAGITRAANSHAKVLDLWCSAARRACLSERAV